MVATKRYSVTREFEISYAHSLPDHKGKCANLHGHNAKIEVTISGFVGDDGMVMDFGDMKVMMTAILTPYDHKHLNAMEYSTHSPIFDKQFPPTAENFSALIMDTVNRYLADYRDTFKRKLRCTSIRMWETEKCFVTVTQDHPFMSNLSIDDGK